MEKRKVGLTVLIPTYNVESYLGRLLIEVLPWADEVIVCDSFSTDKTLEIAKSHNVRVELAYIPRKNKIWGELLGRGVLYPDYQSRLFNKNTARYEDKEVHAQVVTSGKKIYLKHALVHDDFTDISSWWIRNDRYFRYELQELIRNKKKWNRKMQYIRPLYIFWKIYLQKGMFRYGFKGFFVAFQWAVYLFFVYAKLYEHELRNKRFE